MPWPPNKCVDCAKCPWHPSCGGPGYCSGETEDELVADFLKHAKEVHGYTDKQLNDPKVIEKFKTFIKEETQRHEKFHRHQQQHQLK